MHHQLPQFLPCLFFHFSSHRALDESAAQLNAAAASLRSRTPSKAPAAAAPTNTRVAAAASRVKAAIAAAGGGAGTETPNSKAPPPVAAAEAPTALDGLDTTPSSKPARSAGGAAIAAAAGVAAGDQGEEGGDSHSPDRAAATAPRTSFDQAKGRTSGGLGSAAKSPRAPADVVPAVDGHVRTASGTAGGAAPAFGREGEGGDDDTAMTPRDTEVQGGGVGAVVAGEVQGEGAGRARAVSAPVAAGADAPAQGRTASPVQPSAAALVARALGVSSPDTAAAHPLAVPGAAAAAVTAAVVEKGEEVEAQQQELLPA